MATFFSSVTLFFLVLSNLYVTILCVGIGVNYGRIANNLPPPSRVVELLKSSNISRVKLYDADPDVLTAFANSNIEVVVSVENSNLQAMADPAQALTWVQQHVQNFISQTRITGILVGNEVLGGTDAQAASSLVSALHNVHFALKNLGLTDRVYVSSAHIIGVLSNSYPPSSGMFRQDLASYIQPILDFHAQTKSPFLVNAYPFFAYKSDPYNISKEYALFQDNPGVTDPNTNLHYANLLTTMVDAVYAAITAMGHTDIQVVVSETGWPSKGDANENGASIENARSYNGNLIKLVGQNQGTPAKPSAPLDAYIFALFNENSKPGPESERNFGLYYPDTTPVYNVGPAFGASTHAFRACRNDSQGCPFHSASKKHDVSAISLLLLPLASFVFNAAARKL